MFCKALKMSVTAVSFIHVGTYHPSVKIAGEADHYPLSASALLNTNCLIVAYFAIPLVYRRAFCLVRGVGRTYVKVFAGPAVCQAFDQSIHYFYYSHPPKNVLDLDLRIQSSR